MGCPVGKNRRQGGAWGDDFRVRSGGRGLQSPIRFVEHFVGLELLRRIGTSWPEARLFHLRTRSGLEVDDVMEVGRELRGIEVNASENTSRPDFRGQAGLAARTQSLKRRIVLYLGDHAQQNEGHEIPPLRAFLAGLPS